MRPAAFHAMWFILLLQSVGHAQFRRFTDGAARLDPTARGTAANLSLGNPFSGDPTKPLRDGAAELDPNARGTAANRVIRNLDPRDPNAAIRDPLRAVREADDEAAGEFGRRALPLAADIMSSRNGGIAPSRILGEDRVALWTAFGSLAGDVSVVWGAQLLDAWGSGRYTIRLGNSGGQTYGNTIYIAYRSDQLSDYARLKLLTHELVHVDQYRRSRGIETFGYNYFKEWSRAGFSYSGNAMERAASSAENGDGFQRVWAEFVNRNSGQVDLVNRTTIPVSFTMHRSNGSPEVFSMRPGETRWFRAVGTPARFTVEYDSSLGQDVRINSYTLPPAGRYSFSVQNNVLQVFKD